MGCVCLLCLFVCAVFCVRPNKQVVRRLVAFLFWGAKKRVQVLGWAVGWRCGQVIGGDSRAGRQRPLAGPAARCEMKPLGGSYSTSSSAHTRPPTRCPPIPTPPHPSTHPQTPTPSGPLPSPPGFLNESLEFPGQMWAFLSDGLGILVGCAKRVVG